MAKICIICGEDCSNEPRFKNEDGHYVCARCYETQDDTEAPSPKLKRLNLVSGTYGAAVLKKAISVHGIFWGTISIAIFLIQKLILPAVLLILIVFFWKSMWPALGWLDLSFKLFALVGLTFLFVLVSFFNLIMPFLISPEAYEAGSHRLARRGPIGSSYGGGCGSSCGGGCGGGD